MATDRIIIELDDDRLAVELDNPAAPPTQVRRALLDALTHLHPRKASPRAAEIASARYRVNVTRLQPNPSSEPAWFLLVSTGLLLQALSAAQVEAR